MRNFKGLTSIILLMLGAVALHAALPFLFWLPAAKRENKSDPKSSLFFPTNTPGPIGTNTPIVGGTATLTPTPRSTATITPAIAGTATFTPPPGGTATFTPTPGGHGPLVVDFENNTNNNHTLWDPVAALVFVSVDTFGITTMVQSPWTASSGTAPGNGSSYAGCISGMFQKDGPPNYPYAQLIMELVTGGGNGAGGGPAVDVRPYSPNNGLKFDYKAGAAGVQYALAIIEPGVTDYGHYRYLFTSTDTAWHTVSVYFPSVSTSDPTFSQPTWAAPKPFTPNALGAISIQPVANATDHPYNICLDNVTFAAPPATPLGGHGPMVADFEGNTANDQDLWNPVAGAISTAKDTYTTTMSNQPWGPSSGTAPGNGSSFAGCFAGTLAMEIGPPTNQYPYAQLTLNLGPAGADTDVTTYSPNNGLKFDYKSGVAGMTYRLKFKSSLITDYGYYGYVWTAPDTLWHTQTVYFTAVDGTPYFQQPAWAAPVPWNKTKLGAIIVEPVASTLAASPYNICLDNITFAVAAGAAPTPTFTPCAGRNTLFHAGNGLNINAPFAGLVSGSTDAFGSTLLPSPLTSAIVPGGSTIPCGSGGNALCYNGSIAMDGPPNWPYVVASFPTVMGGATAGSAGVNMATYAPLGKLHLHYKANIAGFDIFIQIMTKGVLDYGYYAYKFTPAGVGTWQEVTIDMPGGPGPAVFAQPAWAVPRTWATESTDVSCVQVQIVPKTGVATPYDICIDDISFH